ncbi:MAG: GNAT family N-acetyltransferase [Acholeplasmataceae bacterium]
MSEKIQLATINDLDQVWALRKKATAFLKSLEVDQWQFEDPTILDFKEDIQKEELYVYKIDDEIVGMFALKFGIEPTYDSIDGAWRYHEPYATIHRLALSIEHQKKGIAYEMLAYAESVTKSKGITYMRIDTHEKNLNAQRVFTKIGYVYCGIITLFIKHGEKKRLAYDKKLERG